VMSEGPPDRLSGPTEVSWGLHPWGPVFSRNNWRGPEGRVRVVSHSVLARAHYSASAADIVMIDGVPSLSQNV
jgi:hypothetical protein